MNFSDKSLFLTVKDLVEMGLGKPSTVYKLMNSPDFPSIKVRGRLLVTKEAFNIWLKRQSKQYDPGTN